MKLCSPSIFNRIGSLLLSTLLVFCPSTVRAQTATRINLEVIEGEGAINNVKSRTGREVIVQVTDENHRPVGGAAVTFAVPQQGASGVFLNGAKTVTMVTDNNGRATMTALHPNNVQGPFQIHVNASPPNPAPAGSRSKF